MAWIFSGTVVNLCQGFWLHEKSGIFLYWFLLLIRLLYIHFLKMNMEQTITKDQERYLEERLVEIIVEPDEYGLEEAKANKKTIVKCLRELVNKNYDSKLTDEQVGEFYDRFMAGNIDKAIIGYLDRNFEFFAKISKELYNRVEEFFYLWLKHQYKTRGKKDVEEDEDLILPRKQMKETLKGLRAAMDCLEALNKDSWAIISAYSIIPD